MVDFIKLLARCNYGDLLNMSGGIACIGLGTIGSAWAIAFARAGLAVQVFDNDPAVRDRCLDDIRKTCAPLADTNLVEAILERINVMPTLEQAVADVRYVQESIREEVGTKRALFAILDQCAAPDTIFGSSVSAIPGSEFLGGLDISSRCVVVHPTNPPFLVPLVELCRTPWTSDETLNRCRQLMLELGQVPVVLNREIDGYALNRLQAAVVAESLHLVGTGVISAADLDRVMVFGLGLRWAVMGPFLTGHLNSSGGYAAYMRAYGDTYRHIAKNLEVRYPWNLDLIDRIDGELRDDPANRSVSAAQRERDRALIALRAAIDATRNATREETNHAP